MSNPTVSVIMPCYNAAATLREAVASVLAQNAPDFELLIVDDGSRDDSVAVASELAAGDQRIRVICQANAGPAAARNRGIAEARGTYLAFLDADDRWMPDCLACHIALLNSDPQCGASFARIQFFDPAMQRPGVRSAAHDRLTLAQVLGENPICTTSNLFARRSLFEEIGGFDPELTHGEDQEWVARVLAVPSLAIRGVAPVLVHYRTSPAGLSADLGKMHAGWKQMLEKVREYAPHPVEKAEAEATAIFLRYLARRALRTGQTDACLGPMMTAWRTSPRALLTRQPRRTIMTTLGVLAAQLPGNPAGALLAR
jgi:hypothetical protein